MRAKKISKREEKLVIDLKVKSPYLSCRKIAGKLNKHGINISKSAVNDILRSAHLSKRPKKTSRHSAKLEYMAGNFLPLKALLYIIIDELLMLSEFWSKRIFKDMPQESAKVLMVTLGLAHFLKTPVLNVMKLASLKKIYKYNLRELLKHLDELAHIPEATIPDLQSFLADIVQFDYFKLELPGSISFFVDTEFRSVFTSSQSIPKKPFLMNTHAFSRGALANFMLFTLNGFDYPSNASFQLLKALVRKTVINLEMESLEGKTVKKAVFNPQNFIVGMPHLSMKKGVRITEVSDEFSITYGLPRKKITAHNIKMIIGLPKEVSSVQIEGVLLKLPEQSAEWVLATNWQNKKKAACHYLDTFPDFWNMYQEFLEETTNILLRRREARVEQPFLINLSLRKVEEFIPDTVKKALKFYTSEDIPARILNKAAKFSLSHDNIQLTLPLECKLFPATLKFLKELNYPVLGGKHIIIKEGK